MVVWTEAWLRMTEMSLRAGSMLVRTSIEEEGERLVLSFPYAPSLLAEVKAMEGARWHPDRRCWSVKKSSRNDFALQFLAGEEVFARWEQPLVEWWGSSRPLYDHQIEMARFIVTKRRVIIAAEMGVGKTLAVQEAMEWAAARFYWPDECFLYIAPSAALLQVQMDFRRWRSKVHPLFRTYEALKREKFDRIKFVVFDESTKIKTPTSQRSIAAMLLADQVRRDAEAFIVEMSGSPAPRDPTDWWHQCEVAAPGFLREGNIAKLKARLAILKMEESEIGGRYPKLIAWLRDEKLCATCGQLEDGPGHDLTMPDGHAWRTSINEVAKLNRRMAGLVLVKTKEECLSLPPLVFQQIKLPPKQSILNASALLLRSAKTTIEALTAMRELSDGFSYVTKETGAKQCEVCSGSGTTKQMVLADGGVPTQADLIEGRLVERIGPCDGCDGRGQRPIMQRTAERVSCLKDDALREIIEAHEDVGRLVVYAGFTASVDRVVDIFTKMGWSVVRVDGRGWKGFDRNGEQLSADATELYEKLWWGEGEQRVAFVAQASTAGHGLNLTRAPTEVFFSNDFNYENRVQAVARPHRPGIEKTLERCGRSSVTIIDLIHLPVDEFVLKNHALKRQLQAITLGQLQSEMKETEGSEPS